MIKTNRPMTVISLLKRPLFIFLVGTTSLFLGVTTHSFEESPGELKKPDVFAMENSLFSETNRERLNHALRSLEHFQELRLIAKEHSRNIAASGTLSHISSTGKLLEDYLAEKGFYFVKAGENVAVSESFIPEIIFESLLDSFEHRETILDPDFDRVGIGVVQGEGKGYYVTQLFIKSLEPREEEDVKREIVDKMEEARINSSLPPLEFTAQFDDFARGLSQKRSKELPPPDIPESFGIIHVYFVISPRIQEIIEAFHEDILSARYKLGGLGVTFARSKDYPGGAYFAALMLVFEEDSDEPHVEMFGMGKRFQAFQYLRLDEDHKPAETVETAWEILL